MRAAGILLTQHFLKKFLFPQEIFSSTCRASFLQIPGGQTFWFFFSAQFDQILETRVRKCLGKVYLQLCFILFSQNSLFMTSLIIFCISYLPLLPVQAPTIRDDLRIYPVFHLQPSGLPQDFPTTGRRVSFTWTLALR